MTLTRLIRSASGIVVLETVVLACLMFGTFSVLVRVTDLATIGLWVLVNSLLGFSRAADFWSRGLASFVGEARGQDRRDEAVAFVSTAVLSGFVGYAVLGVVGGVAIFAFAGSLVPPEQAPVVREIVPLMGLTFWLLAVAGTYFGAFLAFGRPILKAFHTIGGALVFLALSIWLAPAHGLWGILIAQSVQAVLILVSSSIIFRIKIARGAQAGWQRDEFRKLVTFGGKMLLVGSMQLAIEPVIRVLASQFGGLGSVAAVELASRLIGVVRNVITALGQILVPEFARLAAAGKAELAALFRDVSRLYLLASLSAFSMLASAAPALEELVLGRSGTGFVAYVWILSIGWFANTVTAPAHFLLISRRRLQPLFWCHFVMTVGAVVLGGAGGWLAGINGAMAGAALALSAAAVYLLGVTDKNGTAALLSVITSEPIRLLPVVCAVVAVSASDMSGLLDGEEAVRLGSYTVTIAATFLTCLVFGDLRGLIQSAARLR